MDAEVPDKLYFKIGEVAKITSLKPSVLRYWETEFSQLSPTKSWSGQRFYTRQDLGVIFTLKKLLYLEKLTLEGARKRLNSKKIQNSEEATATIIQEVKEELRKLRDSLD